MGFLEEALDMAKSISGKISPALNWVSVKAGNFVEIAPENIHMLLLLAISLWLTTYFTRERGIKFWVIGVVLFLGFRYIGM